MDYFLDAFGNIKFGSVVIFIAAIAFAIVFIIKCYKFFIGLHDKMQDKDNTLTKVVEKTGELDAEIRKIADTQKIVVSSIDKISESQDKLADQISDFEKVMKTQSCNKLRDRIVQSHRYYTNTEKNPLRAWTEMEKDAFDRLFKDYEDLGGDGYIHSTVEPDMHNLEVIDMTDYEGLSTLMKSRKG